MAIYKFQCYQKHSYNGNDNVNHEIDIGDGVKIGDGEDDEVFWVDRLPQPIKTGIKIKVVIIIATSAIW